MLAHKYELSMNGKLLYKALIDRILYCTSLDHFAPSSSQNKSQIKWENSNRSGF